MKNIGALSNLSLRRPLRNRTLHLSPFTFYERLGTS